MQVGKTRPLARLRRNTNKPTISTMESTHRIIYLPDKFAMLKETTLRHEADIWYNQVMRSVIRWDNANRTRQHLPPFPLNAYFPPMPFSSQLKLLNLKVWTLRYAVDLDFVVGELLRYYGRHRKESLREPRLGISIGVLTGVASRKHIETAVLSAFPNGENFSNSRAQLLKHFRITEPVRGLDYTNNEEMIRKYTRIMLSRQNADIPVFRRRWRTASSI